MTGAWQQTSKLFPPGQELSSFSGETGLHSLPKGPLIKSRRLSASITLCGSGEVGFPVRLSVLGTSQRPRAILRTSPVGTRRWRARSTALRKPRSAKSAAVQTRCLRSPDGALDCGLNTGRGSRHGSRPCKKLVANSLQNADFQCKKHVANFLRITKCQDCTVEKADVGGFSAASCNKCPNHLC